MRNIVRGEDQLRQRVAWALSQIMVISYNSVQLINVGRSVASYFDTLAEHALGNYRELLFAVSTHPAMAFFLSSLGNQKANADGSRKPDENYAREIMQLFSIGLWELNMDGSRKLDENDEPIPTYDNDDVTELARVFTGLWYAGDDLAKEHGKPYSLRRMLLAQGGVERTVCKDCPDTFRRVPRRPLMMYEEYHDPKPKTIFKCKPWQTTIDNGKLGMLDIGDAVDMLLKHPNTPPFVARRLIQFLVKSHPSPSYIERVAKIFCDNGKGMRGDLHAVVRQVLLDEEARYYRPNDNRHGKLQAPMLRLAQAVKAFRAGTDLSPDVFKPDDPKHPDFNDILFFYGGNINPRFGGQWPMNSPSVFNFFEPDYRHPGELSERSLNSPEFQIHNAVTATLFPNELMLITDDQFRRTSVAQQALTPEFKFLFDNEFDLAHNVPALLNRLAILLAAGELSIATRGVIEDAVRKFVGDDNSNLSDVQRKTIVAFAIWGVLVSPDSAILR